KALSLSRTPLAELWRHPLHTREFGSQITNVLRCLQLEAHGYSVTVTELVGWEHSMKNELILARRMAHDRNGARDKARDRLAQVLEQLNLQELARRFSI
ncbi:MAG: SAM-dependent methyltransferase, partial [Hydrogenophaga sp.]|nr:SAM-dependent methyltransferase [Hydrogenophaga sp.]